MGKTTPRDEKKTTIPKLTTPSFKTSKNETDRKQEKKNGQGSSHRALFPAESPSKTNRNWKPLSNNLLRSFNEHKNKDSMQKLTEEMGSIMMEKKKDILSEGPSNMSQSGHEEPDDFMANFLAVAFGNQNNNNNNNNIEMVEAEVHEDVGEQEEAESPEELLKDELEKTRSYSI